MHRTMPLLKLGVAASVVAALAAAAVAVYAADPVYTPVNASGSYDPNTTLVMYGDVALFAGGDTPDNCVLRSRFKPGEPVGFRMTALDPQTGNFADTAELTVSVTYAGKTESVPMRNRSSGPNPHPGMWTGKWVVPDDAPAGVVKYSVTAKTPDGKSGVWQPFDIDASTLTIVAS
jgi:hypothetical protein